MDKSNRSLSTAVTVCAILAGLSGRVLAQPTIRTVIGTGQSTLSETRGPQDTNLGNPFGVEIGPNGDLYVTEVSNHRIWRLDPTTNDLQVIAGNGQSGYTGDGGLATMAKLHEPYEIRFDRDGNLFVVEMKNHVVRRIEAKTGVITTVAGTGQLGFSGDGGSATEARLNRPHSIAIDAAGNIYIADIGNHRIRKVDGSSGVIHTIAGTGERQGPIDGQSSLDQAVHGPRALFLVGDTLWVALREGNSIWKLQLTETPTWRHVAGTGQKGFGGDGSDPAQGIFNGPKGIAVGPGGMVFVVDTENQVVRAIDTRQNTLSTLAGRGPDHRGYAGDLGPALQASLNRPHGICVDADGRVYIGDSENHRVRVIE